MTRRAFLSALLAIALAPKLVRMEADPMLEHFGPAFPVDPQEFIDEYFAQLAKLNEASFETRWRKPLQDWYEGKEIIYPENMGDCQTRFTIDP